MKSNAARGWQYLPTRERLRCIVVESGSGFPQRTAEGFDETIAIAQMPGELPAAFAQRTLARIAGVERSGRHFESVTVLSGGHSDAASRAARRLIVLGLAAHARACGSTTPLLLQASAHASVQERSELLELVGEVTEASDVVSVRLCFGESLQRSAPAPRSGVFAKPVRGQG